ncbi:DUF5110 domain-containing protein [Curtobacterium sp. MCPF17_052]|uniref:DUF5110 domain-containing protein n=1 Tax=Curtobacterium sp. MCPF17_052 TaxID=2175655 RepID=UPI0024DFF2BF|nr:DUF5110 domain-containing protein [Curtobacterium sp. MCPF17_052]WIB11802.1 glycoside hydrolase family 31 protein [Curtobacterium sp. MCPF17_052]
MLQPLYLQYPEAQESYAQAGSEYLYGKDVLVAPVTTGNGDDGTATRSVWFPAGDSWTDWFTGKTYEGGTTADVTTDLTTMPVFVRSGGIVPTRSHHVANDAAPLDAVTVTVATGADGTFALHEDSGEGQPTKAAARAAGDSASTSMRFTQQADGGTLDIAPADGSFTGQVRDRSWTATFTNAERPVSVTIDGAPVAASDWTYDADSRTITVPVAERSVTDRTVVRYSSVAAAVPSLQVASPQVTAGGTQTVTGSGFPANATVTLSTTPALGGEVTVRTDADGTFSSDLAVPATASGRVTVSASVGGVVLARVAFTVSAAPPDGIAVAHAGLPPLPRRVTLRRARLRRVPVRVPDRVPVAVRVTSREARPPPVTAPSPGRVRTSCRSGSSPWCSSPRADCSWHSGCVAAARSSAGDAGALCS